MTGVAPQYWLDWEDDRMMATAEDILREIHRRRK